ncbi:MAG: glycosyltransferase [Deltaproteobacteria bacterium]|nr:MAG: glycosyltransferase [Deltaproteobacteria bacterium]
MSLQNQKSNIEDVDLSVIIPLFNEAENLSRLCVRMKEVLAETRYVCELIFVDDGSLDNSLEVLRGIKDESENEPAIRIVQLSRNFGQDPALIAGFSVAKGKTLVTIDADLQIDPDHIVPMMDKMDQGFDFVSGIRRGKGDSFWLRRLPSRVLNTVICAVTGKKLRDYGCPLNAMRSEIAKGMQAYGEMQRFFKPLAVRLASRIAEMEVIYGRREKGRSKYGLWHLIDLFFDFVTNFSKQLFQRLTILGACLCVFSLLSGVAYLVLRFFFSIIPEPFDRLQVVLFIAFTFGMQLLVLGVLGDFVIRIYGKIESGPIYEIKKIW